MASVVPAVTFNATVVVPVFRVSFCPTAMESVVFSSALISNCSASAVSERLVPTVALLNVRVLIEASCRLSVAPEFTVEALAILQKKKNLRLLQIVKSPLAAQPWDVRSVGADSFLLQQRDLKETAAGDLKVATKRAPSESEMKAMLFGWRVKHGTS